MTSWVCFCDMPSVVRGPVCSRCTPRPHPQGSGSESGRDAGEAQASLESCERYGGPWCRQYSESKGDKVVG